MNNKINISDEEFRSLWWTAIHESNQYNPCRLCTHKSTCHENNQDTKCTDREIYNNVMEEIYEKDPSAVNIKNMYKRLSQESVLTSPLLSMLIDHYETYKKLVDVILDYNDSLNRLTQMGLDVDRTVLVHTDKLPQIQS